MIETGSAPAALNITAVVTAFHPDERLLAVAEAALETCAQVIIADNTPEGSASIAEKLDDPRVRVLRSGRNLGVAAGLNLGLRELTDEVEAVLLLDQDSVLSKEIVLGLAEHLADPTIAAAAPEPLNADSGQSYKILATLDSPVSDQNAVITSGMLVRRTALDAIGEFREDFFVDFIDMDICLRLRRTGGRIVLDKRLKLPHSIGEPRPHKLGPVTVRVIHYSAWRHYWIARNGTILIFENLGRFPFWSLKCVLYLARWFVYTAVFEERRRTHVPALLRGFLDAVTKRVRAAYLPTGAQYAGSRQPN
jgi:rhamnosyltransferase